MANIEFIAAKDIPVTEASEVDVLCVENGALKRKAGASIGGAGGAGGMVVKFGLDELMWDDNVGSFVTLRNYDDVLKLLEAGGSVCMQVPTPIVNDNGLHQIAPYVFMNVTSWTYLLDASPMGNPGPCVMCACGADTAGMGFSISIGFVNGTYVPNITLDYEFEPGPA